MATAETSSPTSTVDRIEVRVNGEPVETRPQALDRLLVDLGYAGLKVATAINGEFVPERQRAATALAHGDHVEIVAPRQGG